MTSTTPNCRGRSRSSDRSSPARSCGARSRSPPPGVVREAGQPSGACFLMRRETWEEVGGFDDGFFLWYEDVDLAKRLEEAGYRNLLVGSARVGHAAARSFQQLDRETMQSIRRPSLRRYIEKHHRRWPRSPLPCSGSADVAETLRPAVYIPSLEAEELLPRTLESLRRQTRPVDVVLIDNGSTDGSVELVRERFEEVEVLEMRENLGFGPAINRAVRERPADPVILLNNDIECEPGLIEAMLDARAMASSPSPASSSRNAIPRGSTPPGSSPTRR